MKKICEYCIHNACSYKIRGLEDKCEKVQDYEQGYEAGIADMRIENEKAIEAVVRLERKRIIKRASEWLNIFYNEETYSYLTKEDIEQFIKAMEEEK